MDEQGTIWDLTEEFCALRERVKTLESENQRIKDALYLICGRRGGPTPMTFEDAHKILFKSECAVEPRKEKL